MKRPQFSKWYGQRFKAAVYIGHGLCFRFAVARNTSLKWEWTTSLDTWRQSVSWYRTGTCGTFAEAEAEALAACNKLLKTARRDVGWLGGLLASLPGNLTWE